MAEEKTTYRFGRKISVIKDIFKKYLDNDLKKIIYFLDQLESTRPIQEIYSAKADISITTQKQLSTMSLEVLESLEPKGQALYFNNQESLIFPSDLIRVLVKIAILFGQLNPSLRSSVGEEFSFIKKWGDLTGTGVLDNEAINEVAYKDHFEEIQNLLNNILRTYSQNKEVLKKKAEGSVSGGGLNLTEEELKLIIAALEAEENSEAPDAEVAGDEEGAGAKTDEGAGPNPSFSDLRTPDQSSATAPPSITPVHEIPTDSSAQAFSQGAGAPGLFAPRQRSADSVKAQAAFLFNRMALEYGIGIADLPFDDVAGLRAQAMNFALKMTDSELLLMNGTFSGGRSETEKVLRRFYKQFLNEPSRHQIIVNLQEKTRQTQSWNNLGEGERKRFEEIHQKTMQVENFSPDPKSTEYYLSTSIDDILDTKNIVIQKNIKNRLESMIIQYGSSGEQLSDSGQFSEAEINDDLTKIINGLSAQKLAIIFGIPNTPTDEQLRELKKAFLSYVKVRVPELRLYVQTNAITRGLSGATPEEIALLIRNDNLTHTRHISFTATLGAAIEENGAETMAGALNEKRGSKRENEIKQVEKQYKTFFVLWENLSPEEQRKVYTSLGANNPAIAFDKNANKDTPLPFIPEFLNFNLNKLKDAPDELAINAQVVARKDELEKNLVWMPKELADLKAQVEKEKKLAEFFIDSYLYETENLLLLADYLSNAQQIESLNREFFLAYSVSELMRAENEINATGYNLSAVNAGRDVDTTDIQRPQEYVEGGQRRISLRRTGGSNRGSGGSSGGGPWPLNKRFRKSKSPTSKLSKALQKATKKARKKLAEKAATNAAAAALSATGVGTAVGLGLKVAQKIGFKRVAKVLGGAVGVAGRLIASVMNIGGAVGGVFGLAVGGPAGGIAGTFLGSSVWNTVFPSSAGGMFGGGTAGSSGVLGGVQTLAPQATIGTGLTSGSTAITGSQAGAGGITAQSTIGSSAAQSAATQAVTGVSAGVGTTATGVAAGISQTIAASSGVFLGLPISLLSTGGAMLIGTFVTMYTILVIQSAFLVPLPGAYSDGSRIDADLPDGLVACWPTTGQITQLPTSSHEGIYTVGGKTQAFDIAWDGTVAYPPAVHASHNGIVTIIDSGTSGYGLHVKIASPEGHKSIYAHLSVVAPNLTNGQTIGRGDLVGYMGNTGNSSGPHLHYEFSPGLIANVVPNGPSINIYDHVDENCSTGGNPKDFGYIAIGNLSAGNVVASGSNEINSGAILTCGWRNSRGLTAAVNANFFNSEGTGLPVGLAGNGVGDVRYWEDASSDTINSILRTFAIQGGSPSMVDLASGSYNESSMSLAVTGIWASGGSSSSTRSNRTIIGFGSPAPTCGGEPVTGVSSPAMFIGVLPQATYAEAEAMMFACGATQLVHMDGGGSTAFCSEAHNFTTTGAVPVNIGMKSANVIQVPL